MSRDIKAVTVTSVCSGVSYEIIPPCVLLVWCCICVCWAHTCDDVYAPWDLCVRFVYSSSSLRPLGQPRVTRLCSNGFWQLCNFCWFISDLGKLLYSSAGVIYKKHTHKHTRLCLKCLCIHHIYAQKENIHILMDRATNFEQHPYRVWFITLSHISQPTRTRAHSWC